MSAYIKQLQAESERANAARQRIRDEEVRADIQAARERLTPVEERLARVLATIPEELQREGLSLSMLQTSLRGRWRGHCHPGELGTALRKLGYRRERRWRGKDASFCSLWYPT